MILSLMSESVDNVRKVNWIIEKLLRKEDVRVLRKDLTVWPKIFVNKEESVADVVSSSESESSGDTESSSESAGSKNSSGSDSNTH